MLCIYGLKWDNSRLNTDILITDIAGVPSVFISLTGFTRTDADTRAVSLHPASQVTDPTATSHTGKGPLTMNPLLAPDPGGDTWRS